MARRKSTRMSRIANIEPAALTLTLPIVGGAFQTAKTDYVDLSQITSLVNRRFYRQGLNWAVAGMKVLTPTSLAGGTFTGNILISKLPNTWVLANAWKKSMASWTRMNNEALAETESVRPRFLDFKLYADSTHHTQGYIGNLLPIGFDPTVALQVPATLGEWEPSKMVIPIGTASPGATAEREFIAVGSNYPGFGASGLDAVSVIEGYAASRGLPDVLDPNAPDDAADLDGFNPQNWIGATFNQGTDQTEDVLEDMISENNVAPYPFENGPDQANPLVPFGDTMYPGGANQLVGLELHDFVIHTGTSIGGTTRIKGGNFPCGLISITHTNVAEGGPYGIVLQIDLMPGSHRGYLAEPMQEM